MAVFSGALAYFLYTKAQKTIEISEANLFTYLSPFFAAPLAFFWLHESVTPFLIVGSAVTASGILIAELKPHHHINSQNPG
jgi:drug/metabolite transporter (DMT)-like permease